MIELAPERIAAEAGATVAREGSRERPERATIDSRDAGQGDLFFGLTGEHADGGQFASAALEAGAWGVVVRPERSGGLGGDGWVFESRDPLRSLQLLARAWRRELGCRAVGITGSTGKTSVKDITRSLLPLRVHASPENFNTEIGLPLTILAAPVETEVLVLEMAMRGLGQIAELCEIAEPDVAAITNVGPVHLELLGTLEAIAEAKAEILGGLREDGIAVVPVDAEALEPHLHDSLETITFGNGGDVSAHDVRVSGHGQSALVRTPAGEATFELPFARGAPPCERVVRRRDRHCPGLRSSRDGASGSGDRVFAAARGAARARRRNRDRERLLQRQPDLHARGARVPGAGRAGVHSGGAPRRRAGGDEGAGPRRGLVSPRGGRAGAQPRRRAADRRRRTGA